jgi:transcriptional regulator with XRE-family HTH domain
LAAGISQEELAFRAGIDRTYASQIERAKANPSLGITCSIADALGVTAIDLLSSSAV